GDNRLYETLLGFDEGYLGDGPLYRLDVSPEVVSEKGISIPSGNEKSANSWWRPGGRTYEIMFKIAELGSVLLF
ncbi:hypothetical protein HKO46_09730, partial [Streptococcus equi subsp. zooepidemicus]|nr:hypothetical protein [Streptococcus equi subsp. zooepidemicus]NPU63345.1 hypothetical protein [Streptococcus equi subsp. zooepidemicus]